MSEKFTLFKSSDKYTCKSNNVPFWNKFDAAIDERDDEPATLGWSVGAVDGFRRNDDTKYIMRALIINDFVIAKNDSSFVGCDD